MSVAEAVYVDWANTLAPIQTGVLDAVTAAITVGAAIFLVIFGVRKAIQVIRGMSGR